MFVVVDDLKQLTISELLEKADMSGVKEKVLVDLMRNLRKEFKTKVRRRT